MLLRCALLGFVPVVVMLLAFACEAESDIEGFAGVLMAVVACAVARFEAVPLLAAAGISWSGVGYHVQVLVLGAPRTEWRYTRSAGFPWTVGTQHDGMPSIAEAGVQAGIELHDRSGVWIEFARSPFLLNVSLFVLFGMALELALSRQSRRERTPQRRYLSWPGEGWSIGAMLGLMLWILLAFGVRLRLAA